MAEFNYNDYIKNNPLLQKPVKETLLTESQEVSEDAPSSKTTVSELKAEIKEMILASLTEEPVAEAEEDEDVEVDIEDEIEADAEAPEMDMEPSVDPEAVGFSPEEEQIQTSLKTALDSALAIGDEKLADQIGNSITFFTRTHVVQ